ncbi:unnamed protein product [Strongylus vulgaris]|uniref:Uncharacterized protein n=1 Tax=Strongylus vulgaris TaxID=40348 RepID=A0A3P7JB32_STRVU|nr:unnamed protein product [Strongylus vulgaris]
MENDKYQFFLQCARIVLLEYEVIGTQIETLSTCDEVEEKIEKAQEITTKLDQLPDVVKGVLDEFRIKLYSTMTDFMKSIPIGEESSMCASSALCKRVAQDKDVLSFSAIKDKLIPSFLKFHL